MAGGKETPRQKMIGLMYLVLMAMLALNVSKTVLDKFSFIDKSLKTSNDITKRDNAGLVQAIEAVASKTTKKKIQDVRADAMLVQDEAIKVNTFMQEMKDKITQLAGGRDPVTGQLVSKADYTKQMEYTIGPEGAKRGSAYELEKLLNTFVERVNEVGEKHQDTVNTWTPVEKIAKTGKDLYKGSSGGDKDNASKDFATVQFDHTPAAACLAIISQMEGEVLLAQSKLFNLLAKRVDAKVNFDQVVAVVKPESKFVAAGTKYKATMFIAASSSSARPRMSYNNSKVSVVDGVGEIEFTAKPGGKYDGNGRAKNTWKGSITYATPFGDTTLNVEEEYVVIKPSIEINSATVNALYRNCANELIVNVPALGESYNPQFSATNASTTNRGKNLTIFPGAKAKNVTLTVRSGGNKIGTKKFQTKGIPKPDVVLLADGKPVDLAKGIPATARKISVRVKPDPEFASALPKEAQYRVVDWEVLAASGKQALGAPQRIKGGAQDANVAQQSRKLKQRGGGRFVIDIKTVVRKNSKGATEKVAGVGGVSNIPVND